jgi:peptidoglycan/xylan/chitin deacetylase (PgdA/CDA1 family)
VQTICARILRVSALFAALVLVGPAAAFAAPTIVSLTFDDGWDTQLFSEPVLAAHGMLGTFYVNTPYIGTPGHLSWGDLSAFDGAGHEIAGHTLNHPDLTTLTTTQAQHEICDDRANLRARGFVATSFAYPGGAYDSSTGSGSLDAAPIVQNCGYSSGRGAWGLRNITAPDDTRPYATTIPPPNLFKIKTPCCINHESFGGSTPTASALESYVSQAEANGGGWVVFFFHRICDDCGADDPAPSMSALQLGAFLDWLQPRAASGTVVKTVGQVIKNDTQPPTSSIACNGSTCSNGWSNSPVSVSLSAVDSGPSGLASIRYTSDGSEPTVASPTYTGPFSVSTTTTVKFRSWDNASNVEQARSRQIQIDTAAPASAIACNNAPCASTAYAAPVSVTLTASDTGGSGVDAIRYTTDGSDPTPASAAYGGPITVSATTTVKFRSWDVAGNAEATRSQLIQISATPSDTQPPATTIGCNGSACSGGWYGAAVTVTLTAADTGGSGVNAIRYTTNGSDPTPASATYAGPFTVSATTTVKFRAWDNAGNVEPTQTQLIRIDTQAPTVAITSPTADSAVKGNVKITANAADSLSGVVSVSFYVNGTLVGTKVGSPFFVNWQTNKLAKGRYTLTAIAVDAAGNSTTSTAVVVNV